MKMVAMQTRMKYRKAARLVKWLLAAGFLMSAGWLPAQDTPKFTKLVWADEFDTDGLPDPAKWVYQTGFVRNHEAQYYTEDRLENARVENGYLTIEGRKEKYLNADYRPGSTDWRFQQDSASYTSACIVTEGKASWTYGRIEVRAKLPRGLGVWPAIWTLGDTISTVGWPECGEIDIMEFVGHDAARVHGNIHYQDPLEKKHTSKAGNLGNVSPSDDFNTYAIEWDERHITFYYNDRQYHSVTLDRAGSGEKNPFRKPHFILLNLALGGAWGGEIDDGIFPQVFLIDYIRVYQ